MLKKLSDKTGLTDTEIKIFIFLLMVLSVGVGYKHYKQINKAQPVVFNYQVKDSIFNAANTGSESGNNSNKNDKKFDYKQEVLDFNEQNFNKVRVQKNAVEKSINLNKAGLNELISIPGLGEKTAIKILNYRTENGSFKNIEELQEIKGIGTIKFNKIKNYIFIE